MGGKPHGGIAQEEWPRRSLEGGSGVMIPCPRCGDTGMVTPAQARELAAAVYIAPALRAGEAVYRARLEQCASCAALREGVLCAWCGCFVQFRARPRESRCPNPGGDRWLDIE